MRPDPLAYLSAELQALREQGLFRSLRVLQTAQAARASVDGQSVINLSSNNYLGLTTHPMLVARAEEALHRYGVGSGSVRTIAGTIELHMELERRLAAFDLFASECLGDEVEPGAAVLLGDDDPEDAELGHPRHQVEVEAVVDVVLHRHRKDALVDKRTNGLLNQPLFRCKLEIHAASLVP